MIIGIITSDNENYVVGQAISVIDNNDAEIKILDYLKADDPSTIKITAVSKDIDNKCVYHIIVLNAKTVIEKVSMIDNKTKKQE